MREQRRLVRIGSRIPVTYTVLPGTEQDQGLTEDVGADGVRLQVARPVTRGAQLQVTMPLGDRDRPVHFIGEVLWSETSAVQVKQGLERSTRAGVRFKEIAPADRQQVMERVRRDAHQDPIREGQRATE